ncbi:MAG: hypothetical protein EA390_10050 [Balneolaceae bacterium]|nr:MAG: hypothetical protein EA390_10050 [Balneolaceae bacterium]
MNVYLFPNKCKLYGWILFIPSLILVITMYFIDIEPNFLNVKVFAVAYEAILQQTVYFSFIEKNISLDLSLIMLIMGGILVCFSKEQLEDEYIKVLRLESLVWAVYINYAVLILSILFLHELSFLYALAANMVTILIIFIIRFEWVKQKVNRAGLA